MPVQPPPDKSDEIAPLPPANDGIADDPPKAAPFAPPLPPENKEDRNA